MSMTRPLAPTLSALAATLAIGMAVAALGGCVSSRSLLEGDSQATAPGPDSQAQAQPANELPAANQPPFLPGHRWTTQECVQYALVHNRTIAQSRWHTVGAVAQVESANASLMPSITADGSFTTRNNESGIAFEGTDFVTSDKSVASGDVVASVPIFSAANGRRDTASHALSAARAETQQTQSDITSQVLNTVFDIIETRSRIDLIDASVRSLTEEAHIAEDRQKAGLALPSDALASKVRLSEREQDRLHEANAAEILQSRLDRIMGLPLNNQFTFMPLNDAVVPALDEASLTQQAMDRRQDLIASRERLAADQGEVHEAQSAYVPSGSLFGGYYATTDSLVLNKGYFGAGVSVSVPLLDSGETAAQIDSARAKVGEQQEATAQLIDEIHEQVNHAVLTAQEAVARVPVAKEGDELAQQRLDQVQEQYKHGVTDMTTVLDAESEWVRTRLDYIHAQMDMVRSLEDLSRVTQVPFTSAIP